jgi:flagellar assembly factor FliW
MRAKMKIRSRQLGEIEVDAGSIVELPEGLVGYQDQNRFFLVEREEYRPFFWLISSDNSEFCFAVVDPEPFVHEPYAVVLNEADRGDLDLNEGDPVQVLVIASPGERPGQITLNLKGPLLLNPRNRVMRQLLVYSNKLPLRLPVESETFGNPPRAANRTIVRIIGKRAA